MHDAVTEACEYLLSLERMFKRLKQKERMVEARRHRLALKRVLKLIYAGDE
jgi:hypothetical protein